MVLMNGVVNIILMVDVSRGVDKNTRSILEKLKGKSRRVDLILNKIDLVEKSKLLELSEELNKYGLFNETFMIAAEQGDGIDDLMAHLTKILPQSPWMFPEEQVSDMSESLLAAEITREKIFLQLHKEVPYATAVETEKWETLDDGSIRIRQIIYVQRDSQKAIVLGRKGSRLKSIGTEARKELEGLFDCLVHLFLFVKVRENWGEDPERYNDWGLNFKA